MAGAVTYLWKVVGQRSVFAVLDVPDHTSLDQALESLPIIQKLGSSVDTRAYPIRPYSEWAEELRVMPVSVAVSCACGDNPAKPTHSAPHPRTRWSLPLNHSAAHVHRTRRYYEARPRLTRLRPFGGGVRHATEAAEISNFLAHYKCVIVHCMDGTAAKLAAAIGDRVKRERRSRNWTLDQLAESAAVSRRMVVSVEQGAVNPSVGTLLRLSDALGIGLPSLVAPPEPRPVKVTRNGEAAELWSGDAGGRGWLVAGTTPPDVVELWDWTLGPGDRHDSEAHARGTKELVHVLEGSLDLDVDDQRLTLRAGDAVAFPGDVTHAYDNPGALRARFSLAVFEPGVGMGVSRIEGSHD